MHYFADYRKLPVTFSSVIFPSRLSYSWQNIAQYGPCLTFLILLHSSVFILNNLEPTLLKSRFIIGHLNHFYCCAVGRFTLFNNSNKLFISIPENFHHSGKVMLFMLKINRFVTCLNPSLYDGMVASPANNEFLFSCRTVFYDPHINPALKHARHNDSSFISGIRTRLTCELRFRPDKQRN